MAASLFATSQRKQGSTLVLCFALLFVSFLLFYNSPIARFTTAKPGPRSVLRSSILRSAWKPALSEKSAKSLWGGWNEKKLESAPFPKTEREDLLEALVDGDRDAEAGRQLAWGNGKGDGSETRMDKEARALQRGFQVTWGLGKSRLVATKKDVEEGAQEGQGGGSQGERAGFGDNPGLGIRVNEHRDESSKGWTQNLSAQDRSSALERRGAEGIVEEGGELERGAIRLDASTMRPTWQVDSEDTMDLRLAIDDQDFEEESRTGTEDNGTETDGNGTSGNGTDKKGTNGKGTNGNGTNGNGKVRKEQEQGEGKESGVGAEAKKEQSSSQVTEEYPAEGESGLDSEDGETEGLAGVSFLADESDSEAAARKEEEAESETGEVPGNESAGLEEGASYAKLDKGRKSEGDGLVEKGVESSTTKEASQQGGTSESAEEGGQAARETKTPSYEQIVFPSLSTETLPKISLVLPSKLDECHRAVISLILQSSSTDSAEDAGNGNGTEKENGSTKMELQTPPTVTLIGADPDRAHYEVYPFRKWHTLLCPIMNWSDCGSETAHPPRKWERQLGVTFQGQSEPPRWEAEVFPDVSALSYEVSVSGVEVSSVRFDNGTVGETESGLGDQREGEKGSALRAASGFADTGSADSGFAQRFRLPTPSVQIWEAEGTCRQPWNRSRTGCQPLLNKIDLPRAQDFELFRLDEGLGSPTEAGWDIGAGDTVSFVVRPIPDVGSIPLRNLRSGFRSASFNAILESERVILHANISQEFEEGLGGYVGTLIVPDPGDYVLKVALHWVHGTADLFQEPFPESVSSHMQHMYSQCEDARSLVHGSPMPVRSRCENPDKTSASNVTSCQQLDLALSPRTGTEAETQTGTETESKPGVTLNRGQALSAPGWQPRCVESDQPGRWLNLPIAENCRPPFCSGNRSATNVVKEWNGNDIPWVYASYGCQYHMFSLEDITACAGETGVKWIHVVGDSTVREIPSTLFSMDPEMEPMQGRRFESADKRIGASLVANQTLQTPPVVRHGRGRAVLGTRDEPARAADAREMGYERLAKRGKNASARKKVPEAERTRPERNGSRTERNDVGGRPGTRSKHPELSPLRVTFQFFDQMYPMETGTHRDFEGMDRPLLDQFNVTCPADAAACPDVIILSPAMAYALWKQNGSDFETWVTDFSAYIAAALAAPRGPRRAPLRAIWYRSPFMFSQAHERSSPYISLPRLLRFDEAATRVLRRIGVAIFDAMTPTRTRPGTCYDGLHYLMATADGHMGHTSNMLMQMLLNTIFDKCTQVDPA